MDEIKGYFKAIKEIAVDTWNGVLNADDEEIKCVCLSLVTFGTLSVFISAEGVLVVASIIVGLAYAKHNKTK